MAGENNNPSCTEQRLPAPRALVWIYNRKKICLALKLLSHIIVVSGVLLYAYLLHLCHKAGAIVLVKLITATAIPFFAVTLIRHLIDARRPYEVYGIYTEAVKRRVGHSYPSRHVFSLFCIGAAALPVLPYLGSLALILGVLLACARVLLGIHFIRDCVAGALIGIGSGILAALVSGLYSI